MTKLIKRNFRFSFRFTFFFLFDLYVKRFWIQRARWSCNNSVKEASHVVLRKGWGMFVSTLQVSIFFFFLYGLWLMLCISKWSLKKKRFPTPGRSRLHPWSPGILETKEMFPTYFQPSHPLSTALCPWPHFFRNNFH